MRTGRLVAGSAYVAAGVVAVSAATMTESGDRPTYVAVLEAVLPAMLAVGLFVVRPTGAVRQGRLECGLAMVVLAYAIATINGRQIHRHAFVNTAIVAVCWLLVVACFKALAADPSSSRRRVRAGVAVMLPFLGFAALVLWTVAATWQDRRGCPTQACLDRPTDIAGLLVGECLASCVLVAAVQLDSEAALGAVAAFFGINLFLLGDHFGPRQHVVGLALFLAGLPLMVGPWLRVERDVEADAEEEPEPVASEV